MRRSDRNFTKIPGGKLGIIALESCKTLGNEIDNYIIKWRTETNQQFQNSIASVHPQQRLRASMLLCRFYMRAVSTNAVQGNL